VLDTLLFRRLKAAWVHQSHDPDLSFWLDHIIPILQTYEIATTSFTISAPWEKTEFGCVKRRQVLY
jgi:hypothetical protein